MDACWQHFKTRRWRKRSWEHGTPVAMLAGTDARGIPPKTGTEVVGTGLTPKAEIPGRGVMAGGGTMSITGGATVGCTMGVTGAQVAKEFPNELKNSVRLSFGSGGRGGMILMQVLGTFSRACYMTEVKPLFIK